MTSGGKVCDGGLERSCPSVGLELVGASKWYSTRAEATRVTFPARCGRSRRSSTSALTAATSVVAQLLDAGVGTERADLPGHVDDRLVQRVAERVAGVAADQHRPAWAMNPLMWPTSPATTIVPPFSEIPARSEASPSMMIVPPWAEAPAL